MSPMMRRDAIKRTAPEHPAPAESPAVVDGIATGVGLGTSCCEHSLRWHHEERGCGYHGYSEDRCPCLLPFDEALAAHVATARAEALREAAAEADRIAHIGETPWDDLDPAERDEWRASILAAVHRHEARLSDWLRARADREATS